MCYTGYLNDESSVAKMATEDIKVWKVMATCGEYFRAPHMSNYIYPNTRLQVSNQLGVSINHPFIGKSRIYIHEGLHSYSSLHSYLNRIRNTDEIVITECYIPKGSVYFTNGEECVSQNLIFDKSYDSIEYSKYYSHKAFKRFFMKNPKPIYVWKD